MHRRRLASKKTKREPGFIDENGAIKSTGNRHILSDFIFINDQPALRDLRNIKFIQDMISTLLS